MRRTAAAMLVLVACADEGPIEVAGRYDVDVFIDGCGLFPDARTLYVSEQAGGGIAVTKSCQYGTPGCTPVLLSDPIPDVIGWSHESGWAFLNDRICALSFTASSATFDRDGMTLVSRTHSQVGVAWLECTIAYAEQLGAAMPVSCATSVVAKRK